MSFLFGRLRSPSLHVYESPKIRPKGHHFDDDAIQGYASFDVRDPSEVAAISAVVSTLISLYNQVDALIDEAKIKDQVAWELQTDLRFLPSVVAEVLPALNTGNSLFDRNFFRVVQLMCKALEEARGALDDYILANIHILQARTLSRRLADARNRIRHAVSLYNTYCNTHQMTKPGGGPESDLKEPQQPRRISNVSSDDPLLKLKECLQDLENPAPQPCPRRILKLVAKLRANKYNMGSTLYKSFTMDELEHFCRVGGLEALVHLLSCPSQTVQKQSMANLQNLASDVETREKICTTTGALEQLGSIIVSASGEVQHGAVAIVRALMRNNDTIDIGRFALPGIIPKLMQLLTDSSPRVQASAVGVLWELCAVPQHRLIIAAYPGAAEQFVKLIGSPSPAVQFCAAATLQNLCREKAFRAKITDTVRISEKLLALLDAVELNQIPCSRKQAARKLEDLPTAGVVGWAVASLESNNEADQLKGLDVLQKFPAGLMQVAVAEGAVLRLVSLLFSPSHLVQEKAAVTLWRFSIPDENEVIIAAQTSSISRLVAMLDSSVVSVQESAVKVLESLSFNMDNRKRIAQEDGAIEKLAALLFLDSLGAQANAASALWNISNTNTKNKLIIGAVPGALERLVQLLASDSTLVQEKAAGALMNLSYNTSNRRTISNLSMVLRRLVALLESTSTLVHQNAAGALYNLSVTDENGRAIANTEGAIRNLVILLKSMSSIVQEYAAGAIANLAFCDETRESIRQAGAISTLKQLRHSSSHSVRTQAKRALENCC